jgi:hypothetical protein
MDPEKDENGAFLPEPKGHHIYGLNIPAGLVVVGKLNPKHRPKDGRDRWAAGVTLEPIVAGQYDNPNYHNMRVKPFVMKTEEVLMVMKTSNPREKTFFPHSADPHADLFSVYDYPNSKGELDTNPKEIIFHEDYTENSHGDEWLMELDEICLEEQTKWKL